MHPYFTLATRQMDPPYADLERLVQAGLQRVENEGLLVPQITKAGEETSQPKLVWEKGLVDVDRVQKFWPTAPAHGEPGGSDRESRLIE
jgi:lariat debranching enzyme